MRDRISQLVEIVNSGVQVLAIHVTRRCLESTLDISPEATVFLMQ